MADNEGKSEPPSLLRRLVSLLIGVVAISLGAILIYRPISNDRTVLRVDGGNVFVVEVADESRERYDGLSDRDSMGERDGMLFVFEEPTTPAFVMRGMRFPLDILWINQDRVITEIDEFVSPDTYPNESFSPELPVQYVLEINAGVSDLEMFEVGDVVEFERDGL